MIGFGTSKSPLTCDFAASRRAFATVGTAGFEPTTP